MTTSNGIFFLKIALVGSLFLLFWGGATTGVPAAQATSSVPVLMLTVKDTDGQPVVGIVNGQTVVLGWYVDGPVTNCVITQNNSVAGQSVVTTVNTGILPTSGSKEVTPPSDSTTTFVLNCDEYVPPAPDLNLNPPITSISSDQGINLVNNNLTGRVSYLVIRWSSVNATHCSYITKTSSTTGSITETNSYDYYNRTGTSGWILYDGDPRYINETTTFSVTCYNGNTGDEDTAEITVNVSNPPPPNPPDINMWSPDAPSVTRELLSGYAYVDVGFSSINVTSCSQQAYYDNGVQYLAGQPYSWDTVNALGKVYTNIKLATTTIFEVTCSRPAVTIAGETYPATSTTERLRIEVLMPGEAGTDDVNLWDRTTLPPVTASLTSLPNPTPKNALTGKAYTVATLFRENASYCYLSAYQYNPATGDYTAGYSLPNWTQTLYGNGTSTLGLYLATSTRLVADCWRDYDRLYGTIDEQENGHEIKDVLVVTEDPAESAPPPEVYFYGNAVNHDASTMWHTAIERVGFNVLTGVPLYIENSTVGTTSSSISFPFSHPYDKEDTYDIHLKLCDENDGESTFRVYVNGTQVGQYTTDDPNSPNASCGDAYGTVFFKRVAQNVSVADGDTIKVECYTPNDGERCRLHGVLFGATGVVTTPQVNPVVTSVPEPVLWLSDNTTSCWNFIATRPNGTTYAWYGGNAVRGILSINISTSTVFRVTCGRSGDSLTETGQVQVYVPFSTTLSAETMVGTGQCINDGSLDPFVFGVPIDAPLGYGPDDSGFCTPLVDLAAASPSPSLASAVEDNVNGTYDNLRILMVIKNVLYNGNGAELPADSNISYLGKLTIMAAHGLSPVESSIGYFNGTLSAPTADTPEIESPTLTRQFDDIPFGTHEICGRVNLDGSENFGEANPDQANNISCTTFDLPVPRPPMSITTNKNLIRTDQSVEVSWGINVTYQLNCTVRGPGGLNESFDTLVTGPGHTDSFDTFPLTSAGVFELRCTEPITGTTFTEQTRVEMEGEWQET